MDIGLCEKKNDFTQSREAAKWCVFLCAPASLREKIISRKAAKPRSGVFFFAPLRLCEKKNNFTQSRKAAKGRGMSSMHKFQAFPPPAFIPRW
jgi:hypothetical protein